MSVVKLNVRHPFHLSSEFHQIICHKLKIGSLRIVSEEVLASIADFYLNLSAQNRKLHWDGVFLVGSISAVALTAGHWYPA